VQRLRLKTARAALATLLLLAPGCALWRPPPPLELPRPPETGVARGVVFDDRDADGVRGPGEPGLPGVAVSNGREVVRTDAGGRYQLPVGDDTTIFVVKPRDWATPLDALQLPRFYYQHKPAGSPASRHPGVAPTGPLPESIDFPLRRHPEPERFRIVVLADPQVYREQHLDWLARDTVAELVGIDAAFGFSLGDLVGNRPQLFGPLNRLQATIGIPWHNVIGNHDLDFDSPDDLHSDESFERVYGPPTYAFEVGPVHFIVLDDVIWKGAVPVPRLGGRPDIQNYEGGLRSDQIEFVKNDLAGVPRDALVVLAMHIPLATDDGDLHAGTRELLAALSGHPHTFSLAGHRHAQLHLFFGADQGYAPAEGTEHHQLVAATASGGWYHGALDEEGIPHATMKDGAPNGYSIVSFDGSRYSVRFHASRRPASYQMSLSVPARVRRRASGDTWVYANVFAGSERSRVEMRVRGASGWIAMRRAVRPDPLYQEVQASEAALAAAVPAGSLPWHPAPIPRDCRHLWQARLPSDLPRGEQVLEVRATDLFGQTDTALRPFRVD
jgi:hypothetical protein